MERPGDIVERELKAAGIAWTVRIGKHAVYSFCGLTYVVSRNMNRGRTMENTRAGIRRMIRGLTSQGAGDNAYPRSQTTRNGERHEDDQAHRRGP